MIFLSKIDSACKMKSWFPFTDYDFYAYLTGGVITLSIGDTLLNNGAWIGQDSWSLSEGILLIALSYVVGQAVALLSSQFLEYGLARTILRPPISLILALEPMRRREKVVSFLVGSRGYSPLPISLIARSVERVSQESGEDVNVTKNAETAFQIGYLLARANEDTRTRLDSFRNQYGFCRNVAFIGLIASPAFAVSGFLLHESLHWNLAALSLCFALIFTVRFLKFYSAFAIEALRPTWGGYTT